MTRREAARAILDRSAWRTDADGLEHVPVSVVLQALGKPLPPSWIAYFDHSVNVVGAPFPGLVNPRDEVVYDRAARVRQGGRMLVLAAYEAPRSPARVGPLFVAPMERWLPSLFYIDPKGREIDRRSVEPIGVALRVNFSPTRREGPECSMSDTRGLRFVLPGEPDDLRDDSYKFGRFAK